MKVFDFIKSKIKLNKAPKQRLLLKQASLLCVTVVMLVCVVFAWFAANNGEATADGISISMIASDNMSISLNGKDFFGTIDILDDNMQNYISEDNKIKGQLNMEDLTSDGKNFLRPVFEETEGVREPNIKENWNKEPPKNRSYISQEITFRTSSACNIYMGSNTKIKTSCEILGNDLVNDTDPSEIGNKNATYNFSNDCIVGALRLSAVDSSGNLCFLCIPRSDVELVRNKDDQGNEIVIMNTGDAVSKNAEKHLYYSLNYQSEGAPIEAKNVILDFDGTQKIATTTLNKTTGYYEATATVNIWIEGCDSETTRVLAGGKFNFNFDFVATEVVG